MFEKFREPVRIADFLQLVYVWQYEEFACDGRLVRPFVTRHSRFELKFVRKLIDDPWHAPHRMREETRRVVSHDSGRIVLVNNYYRLPITNSM